jgi:ribosomal protein S12 methylthiotransferase accessory factor YcaO
MARIVFLVGLGCCAARVAPALAQTDGAESIVVVDLTQPRLGIPVVKVIVPGLEGVVTSVKTHVHGARAKQVREGAAGRR